MSADTSSNNPIHVAITRRIKPGCEADFQEALREFFKTSFAHLGVHGASMLVPPPGSTSSEYGILRTFANEQERDAFYASPLFQAWKERIAPLKANLYTANCMDSKRGFAHHKIRRHAGRWRQSLSWASFRWQRF